MTHYESSLHIPIVTTLIYSNVFQLLLLSFQNYNTKLSDFGLARDGPEGDKTHVSTRVMGTYGYAAPEYVMTGKLKIIFLFFLLLFKLCCSWENNAFLRLCASFNSFTMVVFQESLFKVQNLLEEERCFWNLQPLINSFLNEVDTREEVI